MNELSSPIREWISKRALMQPEIDACNQKWSAVALKSDVKKSTTESAITLMYTAQGQTAPPVVWCKSPREIVLTEALLNAKRRKKVSGFAHDLVAALSTATQERDDKAILETVARKTLELERKVSSGFEQNLLQILPRPSYVSPQAEAIQALSEFLTERFPDTFVEFAFGRFRLADSRSTLLSTAWRRTVADAIGDPRADARWLMEDEDTFFRNILQVFARTATGTTQQHEITADEYIRAMAFRAWGACIGALNDNVRHVVASLELLDEFFGIEIVSPACEQLKQLCQNTHVFLPTNGYCLVSEYPQQVHRDAQGRLHNSVGPAVRYSDGWSIYAINGLTLPEDVIADPASLTIERVNAEKNVEIRRAMIEHYGQGRYLLDCNAKQIQEDECGVLYRIDLHGDEPLVMVKVKNSTASPDGTFEEYFLRVPPSMRTAREAVAWTYSLSPDFYNPTIES